MRIVQGFPGIAVVGGNASSRIALGPRRLYRFLGCEHLGLVTPIVLALRQRHPDTLLLGDRIERRERNRLRDRKVLSRRKSNNTTQRQLILGELIFLGE